MRNLKRYINQLTLGDHFLLYALALTKLPNIGPIVGKKLIAYCGGPEAVFREKKHLLEKVPGVGKTIAKALKEGNVLQRAEQEMDFIQKNQIQVHDYLSESYPNRLKHCEDAPILLFSRGNINFNPSKILAIVGTRNPTGYGKKICEGIIKDLAYHHPDILIVSGMAYGIDICAHKSAHQNKLQTIGVMAHGLDRVYPSIHRSFSQKMEENGGLCTEFFSQSKPDRENFPKRNRIVAGIADATLVIESNVNGGSMITANLAVSYHRDVLAIPGNITASTSQGPNQLIKTNRASLVESAEDIEKLMLWDRIKPKDTKPIQAALFHNLSEKEQTIMDLLKAKGELPFNQLSFLGNLKPSEVSYELLQLELKGLISSKPGNIYTLL